MAQISLAGLVLIAARPSAAAVPSDCPRTDAVLSELQALTAGATMPEPSVLDQAVAIDVTDLGAGFRVVVNGRARAYKDEGRDCARRARVAAVFVAVALGPPPAPREPVPPPVITAAAPTPPVHAAQLELGVAVASGVAAADRATLLGPAVRLAVGARALRFVAGFAVLAPAETTVGAVTVRQWRLPVDAGLRTALRAGPLALFADLGLAAGLLFARAPDLVAPSSATILEWGGRAGVTARYRFFARLTPFVGADVQLVANPAELHALPRGVIGHAPPLWIGARAGASVGF